MSQPRNPNKYPVPPIKLRRKKMQGIIVGPYGEKRMADPASAAVQVGRILAGEIEEKYEDGAPNLRAQRKIRTFDAEDPKSVAEFAKSIKRVKD